MAQVGHPAHVEPCDLDANGAIDLVVADLGSFLPEDHERGRVVWLRNTGRSEGSGQSARYEQIVLLDGVGRIADVRPFDPDGDGDQDLVLAEFGWQTTGSIRLLINDAATPDEPQFSSLVIDRRHGAIHVPVWDWNGDARDDFCGLISQEHETIELFSSVGDGTFQSEAVSPPEDPAFGSSGIELVDLDSDGDMDVLYTNGDTFDSYELKPYHGIQWIENRGRDGWTTHHLTAMPGVQKAVAGDLDGDGDNDVVAVSFLPDRVLKDQKHPASEFDSLIWLEQTGPGRFVRHSLERGLCHHVALELVDFDGDGRLDVAVGNFQAPGEPLPATLWLNLPFSD